VVDWALRRWDAVGQLRSNRSGGVEVREHGPLPGPIRTAATPVNVPGQIFGDGKSRAFDKAVLIHPKFVTTETDADDDSLWRKATESGGALLF
jgi:hypothetical protein